MKWVVCAVAAVGLLVLGLRAGRIGLAGDELDPVGHISAQDEALYAHSAIAMAQGQGWLTPMFMGRYGLYKPPLLMWASGMSAKLLGVSTFSLRLPSVAVGVVAICLVFLWVLDLRGWAAAVAAAALILSNRLWLVMAPMCLTDGMLAGAMVVGFYALHRDPRLETRRGMIAFTLAIAAGILAKSVAGVLPMAVLALYWVMVPAKLRPSLGRAVLAIGLACAAASPWFLYQLAVHPRWFLAEHIGLELVAFGTRTPPQTSTEGHVAFYLSRLWLLDPALLVLSVSAVPAWVASVRKRSPGAMLLLSWILVLAGSALSWRYRNLSYLLPLVPAMAILAAGYGPLFRGRWAPWALGLVALVCVGKASDPAKPWGLSFASGTTLEVAPLLTRYCEMGRGNELIEVGMDDALYGSALPLARLRYLFVGAKAPPATEYSLDFAGMGIVLPAADFEDVKAAEGRSLRRLREWGLDSTAPVGTVILAHSKEELREVMRAHPGSDFLLPEEFAALVGSEHEVGERWKGRVLILSREEKGRVRNVAGCRM
jgi:4-amino-4-deoxy-L-arabinose transferase-like glycosyltransferase